MLDEVAVKLTQAGFSPRQLVESETDHVELGDGIDCFLFPVANEWGPPAYMTGQTRYPSRYRFGVLLVIPIEDQQGGPEVSTIETQAINVAKALSGWQPPSATGPVSPRQEAVQAITRGRVWWSMEFEVEQELRI